MKIIELSIIAVIRPVSGWRSNSLMAKRSYSAPQLRICQYSSVGKEETTRGDLEIVERNE
jgi:hypothetical protein